jgi:hypothetical protein
LHAHQFDTARLEPISRPRPQLIEVPAHVEHAPINPRGCDTQPRSSADVDRQSRRRPGRELVAVATLARPSTTQTSCERRDDESGSFGSEERTQGHCQASTDDSTRGESLRILSQPSGGE